MLKILPNNKLEFEEMEINLGGDELPKFLLANLSESVSIEPGVTIMELLHLFFNIKEFVTNYCCEDYFTVNAVFSALELQEDSDFNCVTGYRELVISHKNDLIEPLLIDFSTLEGVKVKYFRELEVRLSDKVNMKDHEGKAIREGLIKPFSLLELVSLFFEELYHIATNTSSELSLVKM